jgi:hypothetical protein
VSAVIFDPLPYPPPASSAPPRPGRRASLDAAEFSATVIEHLVHTCAKDPREASALDLYQAFAHTVRDRLVHRWLATQKTHLERDVKRACYVSSEFLTGRSLGLCLMNMGLYEAALQITRHVRDPGQAHPRVQAPAARVPADRLSVPEAEARGGRR